MQERIRGKKCEWDDGHAKARGESGDVLNRAARHSADQYHEEEDEGRGERKELIAMAKPIATPSLHDSCVALGDRVAVEDQHGGEQAQEHEPGFEEEGGGRLDGGGMNGHQPQATVVAGSPRWRTRRPIRGTLAAPTHTVESARRPSQWRCSLPLPAGQAGPSAARSQEET